MRAECSSFSLARQVFSTGTTAHHYADSKLQDPHAIRTSAWLVAANTAFSAVSVIMSAAVGHHAGPLPSQVRSRDSLPQLAESFKIYGSLPSDATAGLSLTMASRAVGIVSWHVKLSALLDPSFCWYTRLLDHRLARAHRFAYKSCCPVPDGGVQHYRSCQRDVIAAQIATQALVQHAETSTRRSGHRRCVLCSHASGAGINCAAGVRAVWLPSRAANADKRSSSRCRFVQLVSTGARVQCPMSVESDHSICDQGSHRYRATLWRSR